MKDRERFMEGQATELEKLLLRAVASERPSRALTRRMRLGIGLTTSFFTLKAAAAALSISAVVTAIAVTATRSEPVPQPVMAPAQPPRSAVRAAEPPKSEPAVVQEEPSAPETPEASAEPAPQRPEPRQARTAVAPKSDLREQLQLLDQARAALRAGATDRALADVKLYSQRYPRGAFGQEAAMLRIEALKRSGDDARATALARDFARRYPSSPHLERLSRIVPESKLRQ